MRLLTPEIAWHETLPIYSCDLQPYAISVQGFSITDVGKSSKRVPLTELSSGFDLSGGSREDHAYQEWTRLATAGGDNVVRLWRVRLAWISTTFRPIPSEPLGLQPSVAAKKITDPKHKSLSSLAEHLTYLASLKRHEKPVNVVRWSPSGEFLASGGDDLYIVIWANQGLIANSSLSTVDRTETAAPSNEDDEDESASAVEHWVPCRSLRRHLEDIYDLCWSPDNQALISGSVDHSVIVWQLDLAHVVRSVSPTKSSHNETSSATNVGPAGDAVSTGALAPTPAASSLGTGNTKCLIVRDHKHYVQGVTWDPLGFYVASLSSDRACRIYRAGTRNCLAHVAKAGKQRLFQDDSWKSFFRRLSFSPDGLLLICPSGNLEEAVFAGSVVTAASLATNVTSAPQSDSSVSAIPIVAPQHAAHLFLRSNFTRPAVSLPTGARPVVTVRFCPQPFQLRTTTTEGRSTAAPRSLFDLPYRWLFCLVLEDGLLFYDTQQTKPFAHVSQAHYQAMNDVTWSTDGHLVVACSTDGYCSLIHFARGELGAPYRGPIGADALNGSNAENARRPISTNPVFTTTEQSPTNAGFDAAVPVDEQPLAVEEHQTLRQGDLEVVEIKTLASETSGGASSHPVENLPINAPAASCAQSESVRKRRVPFTTLSVGNQPAVGSTTCNQNTAEQLTSSNNSSDETQCAAIKHLVDSVQKRRVPFVTLESHITSASDATEQHRTASTSLLLSSCDPSDFSGKVSNTPRNGGCQKAIDAISSSS
ncbi:Chromatin assembly factor 1 subunit b [Paragonimus heterotremus]|uniref:Chromatin assembly factor 1 subunit b n=1 Tax=Paragonimus heterotremus TaxID=100268 RepID=A0A8J4TGT5_9TREM|nr:Chromatin assembly factor 1 subunit b [Paragonimus heterotremus]